MTAMRWKEVDKQISHYGGSSGVFSPPKDNPPRTTPKTPCNQSNKPTTKHRHAQFRASCKPLMVRINIQPNPHDQGSCLPMIFQFHEIVSLWRWQRMPP